MKKIFYILILISTVFAFSMSCSKEDALNVDVRDFNPDNYVKGPLDQWITQEYLNPYNIEVIYRWKRELSPVGKEMVPPNEDRVKDVLEAVRDTWLTPYLQVAGKDFIKPLAPKQIVLHGSEEFNDDGTITLGTADGGRRVVLNVINQFDKTNIIALKQMMHTVHHEFTHIMNQMVLIAPDYKEISRGGYNANWTSEYDDRAKELGFVSRYARMNELEDFAEMTSHLLVYGQSWFDKWVESSPNEGAAKLRLKEKAVRDYFLLNFNVDFKELQNEIEASFERIAPISTLPNLIRTGAVASISGLNPTNKTPSSAAFLTVYNKAVAAMTAIGTDHVLDDFDLIFDDQGRASLFIKYTWNLPGWAVPIEAALDLDMIMSPDGKRVRFIVAESMRGGTIAHFNFDFIKSVADPLLEYLKSNTFELRWADNIIPGSEENLVGLFVVGDPTSYLYGTINKR